VRACESIAIIHLEPLVEAANAQQGLPNVTRNELRGQTHEERERERARASERERERERTRTPARVAEEVILTARASFANSHSLPKPEPPALGILAIAPRNHAIVQVHVQLCERARERECGSVCVGAYTHNISSRIIAGNRMRKIREAFCMAGDRPFKGRRYSTPRRRPPAHTLILPPSTLVRRPPIVHVVEAF
jgi:hypothetical protein